jgi:hypothetical protein
MSGSTMRAKLVTHSEVPPVRRAHHPDMLAGHFPNDSGSKKNPIPALK